MNKFNSSSTSGWCDSERHNNCQDRSWNVNEYTPPPPINVLRPCISFERFTKTHSCMFFLNCARNHTITTIIT